MVKKHRANYLNELEVWPTIEYFLRKNLLNTLSNYPELTVMGVIILAYMVQLNFQSGNSNSLKSTNTHFSIIRYLQLCCSKMA